MGSRRREGGGVGFFRPAVEFRGPFFKTVGVIRTVITFVPLFSPLSPPLCYTFYLWEQRLPNGDGDSAFDCLFRSQPPPPPPPATEPTSSQPNPYPNMTRKTTAIPKILPFQMNLPKPEFTYKENE